jgi:hypothetical protein
MGIRDFNPGSGCATSDPVSSSQWIGLNAARIGTLTFLNVQPEPPAPRPSCSAMQRQGFLPLRGQGISIRIPIPENADRRQEAPRILLGKGKDMADDMVQKKIDDRLIALRGLHEFLNWTATVGLSEKELKKLLAWAMAVQTASVPLQDRLPHPVAGLIEVGNARAANRYRLP